MLIDETTFKLLKSAIHKDGWLNLPAYGNSMYPYIQQGDLCRFTPCDPSLIKTGDVILFFSETGQLIAHRFVQKKTIKNKQIFLFKGDTNLGLDQPIEAGKILGRLISIEKQNFKITSNQITARLWAKLILMVPALSGILRKLINMKYKLQF
ncbi:signal peptidase [Neobacillus niacini]|uniref:signal peptidase I n=1 Tax=Neobacillus driksii TaxID=3035913 RepID=UPI002784AE38|nr:signal peptidase I [Neobacillus niacini]MDQ0975388.1 signal peptidase [Neobacillus niacini]